LASLRFRVVLIEEFELLSDIVTYVTRLKTMCMSINFFYLIPGKYDVLASVSAPSGNVAVPTPTPYRLTSYANDFGQVRDRKEPLPRDLNGHGRVRFISCSV